jgi:hypothetical protein
MRSYRSSPVFALTLALRSSRVGRLWWFTMGSLPSTWLDNLQGRGRAAATSDLLDRSALGLPPMACESCPSAPIPRLRDAFRASNCEAVPRNLPCLPCLQQACTSPPDGSACRLSCGAVWFLYPCVAIGSVWCNVSGDLAYMF